MCRPLPNRVYTVRGGHESLGVGPRSVICIIYNRQFMTTSVNIVTCDYN